MVQGRYYRPDVEALKYESVPISPIKPSLAAISRFDSISSKMRIFWDSSRFFGAGLDESSELCLETIGGIGGELALRFRRCLSGEHIETSSTSSASPGSKNENSFILFIQRRVCNQDEELFFDKGKILSANNNNVVFVNDFPVNRLRHVASMPVADIG